MSSGFGEQGWGGTLISGGGGGGGGGGAGPLVTNFVPVRDTPIFPSTVLTFDVLTANVLAAMVVFVDYDGGASERAWSLEQGFALDYQAFGTFPGSEKQLLGGGAGFHFLLRRRSGWFASPTVRVEGADVNGGVATVAP